MTKTSTEAQVYPNFLQAFGLTLINLGLLHFLTIGLFSIFGNGLSQTSIILIGYILSMSATLYLGKGFRKNSLGNLPTFIKKIDFQVIGLLILATGALDLGIVLPLAEFIPISDQFKTALIQNLGNLDIFLFLAMVICAPIFEEYIYRGILLDGLLKNYNPWLAISISSLLFGALHVNPIQFISATLGGFFLGWVYYKSRNLVYCTIIHFIINLFGFFTLKNIGIEKIFEVGFIELIGGFQTALPTIFLSIIIFYFTISVLQKLLKP